MFRADIVVVHGFGQLLGLADDPDHFRRHGHLALSFDGGNLFQHLFQTGLQHGQIRMAFGENRGEKTFRFLYESHEHVDGRNFLVIVQRSDLLG